MIAQKEIKNVLDFVTKLIVEQVENGTQTKTIPETFNASSCGQFIIKDKKQRGVHGTSAAIRVLAGTKNDIYNDDVNRLISYLLNREEIDIKDKDLSHTINFHKDNQNIIKLSEQLHSLSYVKIGVANISTLPTELLNHLIKCYKQRGENGWSYFLNNQKEEFELLPTSFAVMAISVHGDCSKIIKGIKLIVIELEKFDEKENYITDPTTFAILIFALYVLTFKVKETTRENLITEAKLKKILHKLWSSEYCVFDTHNEQDVDYWSLEDESFNVRIPWQLYIIALSAYYDSRKFSSLKVQKLLKSICLSKEFKYPYSGKYMSTRTLSILFETFASIEKKYNGNLLYSFYNLYDKVLHFLGHMWVRNCLRLIFLFLVGYVWVKYTHESDKILDHLAPHVLIAIVMLMLEAGKKR